MEGGPRKGGRGGRGSPRIKTQGSRNHDTIMYVRKSHHYLPGFVKELVLLDTPAHMTLLNERPSGKLCVNYQKLSVVDAIDKIKATT